VAGVVLETWVRDPCDLLVVLEPLCERERVRGVALHTQAQGLEALDQLEGAEGVEAGAEVAQDLDTHADREGDGAKGFVELEPVVALRRFVELRETLRVLPPVELTGVDDNASDGGAVATNPLGG
jgi:hypothetical protein